MKTISIATVFPQLYKEFLHTSLIGRAVAEKSVAFDVCAYTDVVPPKTRIDAPTFGPGPGMLIKPKVIDALVDQQDEKYGRSYKVFFSPQGKRLNQDRLKSMHERMQSYDHIMLFAARYEGMDARVEEYYADEIISVGDFVLMGGDVPAMMFLEGLLRLYPGVVGKPESVDRESFSGPFLDYPVYTEPIKWHDIEVPEIVRSGDHAKIESWRNSLAAEKTIIQRFDWFRHAPVTEDDRILGLQYVPLHYIAIMHTDVLVGPERIPGQTSVTSIDIHDSARSSKTYGISKVFLVTPLIDQQKIVEKFLDFWRKGYGIEYNPQRHEVLKAVSVVESLDAVKEGIFQKSGKEPIVIATSALNVEGVPQLTYFDQDKIWQHGRPVLFVFGTGQGLSPDLIARCDYLLEPLCGLPLFNHLSVRSAIGITLDRWLGLSLKKG